MIRVRPKGLLGVIVGLGVCGYLLFMRGQQVPSGESPDAGSAEGSWASEDWRIFEQKVRWAVDMRLDTLPLGQTMVALGGSFVGTAYVPRTLEPEGPEHLVINFRVLDCVTFVENVFALARFIRTEGVESLADRGTAEGRYEALLGEHRYRDGRIDDYPSRLHYFSDWVADNARRGLVTDVSEALGGSLDSERVDFMTTHTDAYRQLTDAGNLARVREAEARLTAAGRYFVPEDRISEVADGIRDGDIIAATSSVSGLDVAHTGIAVWVDGALHLLHAPLVGEAVQLSVLPLADRIARIDGQDGIIVARPRGR